MIEIRLSDHIETDELIPDAEPKRKMFSSIPVGQKQYAEDSNTGDMKILLALAHAIEKDGPLK